MIPQGVARDTLCTILAGWYEAGAATDPVHTGTVADRVDHPDATARQTPFFEAIGALDADGQAHRLTDAGLPLAAALADGRESEAQERFYGLLSGWPLAVQTRDLVRGRPLTEDDLLPRVAELADADIDDSRDRIGLRTLLDTFAWAGVLDRTDDGRYLPGRADTGSGSPADTSAITVGLELSVDVDPNDVEDLVRAVRRGLDDDLAAEFSLPEDLDRLEE